MPDPQIIGELVVFGGVLLGAAAWSARVVLRRRAALAARALRQQAVREASEIVRRRAETHGQRISQAERL